MGPGELVSLRSPAPWQFYTVKNYYGAELPRCERRQKRVPLGNTRPKSW